MGRVVAIYSETGGGKTTQAGELAKDTFKRGKGRTLLFSSDLGGHGSIDPLIDLGVIRASNFNPALDDPWLWVSESVRPTPETLEGIGLVVFDSGTSMGEALLTSCATLSAGGEDIGGRPAPKFVINKSRKGGKEQLKIGSNVDSHYMVVQGFMREMIWRSTWIAAEGGPDVLWTFGLYRGENATDTPVYGPQMAGKALTPLMPKWFNYTFPIVKVVSPGSPTQHVLYLQEQPDQSGLATYYANSRYALDAEEPLPIEVNPASLPFALDVVARGSHSATERLRVDLGL